MEKWTWLFSEEQEEPPVWATTALDANEMLLNADHPEGPRLTIRRRDANGTLIDPIIARVGDTLTFEGGELGVEPKE
jgi:hypothetical protein